MVCIAERYVPEARMVGVEITYKGEKMALKSDEVDKYFRFIGKREYPDKKTGLLYKLAYFNWSPKKEIKQDEKVPIVTPPPTLF